jgi:signal transduction histidine kinase
MPLEEYPVNLVMNNKKPLDDQTVGIFRPDTEDIVWVLVNADPKFDAEKKINEVIVTFMDITEHKKAEEEVIKAKNLAENSEKLKSEFLAQMSHEIRTPINALLSFSNLLKDEIGELVPEEMESVIDIMENAGKRIIRTIDLILNMSEVQTGTYHPSFKHHDIYEDILIPLSSQYEHICKSKGIDLIVIHEGDSFNVKADEYSVTQIFDNLLGNAIKYTMEGKIEINCTQEGSNIIVEISDTGIGISEEYLPEMFHPFSQEEQGYTRKFEGSGLGLALVKKYCDLNSAKIEIESKKGKGSTFKIIFTDS